VPSATAEDVRSTCSFLQILAQPDLSTQFDEWYADGILLCKTVAWGRKGRVQRYSFDFSSIAGDVLDEAVRNSARVALLGGTQNENAQARAFLQAHYKTLDIVWSRSGYFDDMHPGDDRAAVLADLVTARPQVVIIGAGTPLQEHLAVELKSRFEVGTSVPAACSPGPVIFTCGGFLTQTGMGGDYYPQIIKRTGLRWLYRAVHHSHVRKRLLVDYPRFLGLTFISRLIRSFLRAP
jgi:N-acetylglucosaminyldiphosphoundecaprenol N-acetyl-beta-D-mannosaminyltransferase